jgi:hypothetical protein
MMLIRKTILLATLTAMLAGCGAIDRLTGQTDNTVLPGKREDAIPGRSQFPDTPDPVATGASQPAEQAPPADSGTGCQPDDPACQPPSGNDTFSDPQ